MFYLYVSLILFFDYWSVKEVKANDWIYLLTCLAFLLIQLF
jgi:hypothetical protein